MFGKTVVLAKGLAALMASVGLLTGVDTLVHPEVLVAAEDLAALEGLEHLKGSLPVCALWWRARRARPWTARNMAIFFVNEEKTSHSPQIWLPGVSSLIYPGSIFGRKSRAQSWVGMERLTKK